MKLIVGLGNPGKTYDNTRHNVGFMALDKIATFLNIPFSKNKFNAIYIKTKYKEEEILLVKPQKFMNLSGEVVQKFACFYKIETEDVLIIHDDLDLEIGTLKIKPSGSSGGHNGLRNIEKHLHTKDYKRIKIGISNDKERDTKEYVLEKFGKQEEEIIQKILEIMPSVFDDYMNISFDLLMNKYNRK